jgi:hypothetical protein
MPDHDMTDDETRSVAPADRHPLIQTALLVRLSQPLEEQLAVYNQRRKALRWFEITREKLAADPTATEDDLAFLDNHIRWWREKLDAGDNQLERRRLKTRERVARWRARKAGERTPDARGARDGRAPRPVQPSAASRKMT